MLQIEGVVYEAEHTLIQSIAYPSGSDAHIPNEERTTGVSAPPPEHAGAPHRAVGGGDGSCTAAVVDERETRRKADLRVPRPSAVGDHHYRGNNNNHDNKGKGKEGERSAAETPALPTVPPPPLAAGEGRGMLGAGNGDGDADDGRGGSGPRGGQGDGVDRGAADRNSRARGDLAEKGGRRGAGGIIGDACGVRARAAAVGGGETAAGDARGSSVDGRRGGMGRGDGARGVPFCGLLFPGVLLKFWVSGEVGA